MASDEYPAPNLMYDPSSEREEEEVIGKQLVYMGKLLGAMKGREGKLSHNAQKRIDEFKLNWGSFFEQNVCEEAGPSGQVKQEQEGDGGNMQKTGCVDQSQGSKVPYTGKHGIENGKSISGRKKKARLVRSKRHRSSSNTSKSSQSGQSSESINSDSESSLVIEESSSSSNGGKVARVKRRNRPRHRDSRHIHRD